MKNLYIHTILLDIWTLVFMLNCTGTSLASLRFNKLMAARFIVYPKLADPQQCSGFIRVR